MQLTQNPIEDVLVTGRAENTPLAERLIESIHAEMSISVAACYVTTGTHLDVPFGKTIEQLVRKRQIRFVDEMNLFLYIRGLRTEHDYRNKTLKEALYTLFTELLRQEGLTLPYNRYYLPEEMAYYGWLNSKREDWDMTRMIPQTDSAFHRHAVYIESIDELVLQSYLCDYKAVFARNPLIEKYNAKLYFGYHEKSFRPCYYVILPSDMIHSIDRGAYARSIAEHLCERWKEDRWKVVTPKSVMPIVTKWDALTPEMRFALEKI